MKTSRVVAAAGFLALAAAGCSSSSSPSAGAVASSIRAQATAPAAAASAASSAAGGGVDRSKDCPDAISAAKAALAGMSVTDVSLPEGCTVVHVKTPTTDQQIGKDMCDKGRRRGLPARHRRDRDRERDRQVPRDRRPLPTLHDRLTRQA